MNAIFNIVLFSLIVAATSFAQTQSDSTQLKPKQESAQQMVDEDGDGIDDRGRGKDAQRGKDRFIDKDGDGICDGRESGLGFRGGKSGTGGGTGRQWRGGKK